MQMAALIGEALEEAGTAVAVLAHPERGRASLITHVNATFATLFGQPREAIPGLIAADLQRGFVDPAAWTAFLDALQRAASVQLEIALRVGAAERWVDLRVSFPAKDDAGQAHAVLTGRDLTEAHRSAAQEDASRRLLAAIFSRINAPVAIVTAAGEIMLSNPAFHNLLGYQPSEMHKLRVEDLTAPDFASAAKAARARQLIDGQRYDMRIETIGKAGRHIPVQLTSVLLHDGDQRMRVVTLLPEAEGSITRSREPIPTTRNVGELRAVSLSAFRTAFGPGWERIADRAMMKAEQIIRRRLRPEDVVSRSDDHSFILWFDRADEEDNAVVLAAIVREVRLRFLTDFGTEIASHVSAAIVPGDRTDPDPAPRPQRALAGAAAPPGTAFEQMLRARQQRR
jgi:PAS domain S-box-containing protein